MTFGYAKKGVLEPEPLSVWAEPLGYKAATRVTRSDRSRTPLLFLKESGGVLLSHTLASAVPSALKGLASGFGM